jgi:hypothetical protein
MARLAVGMVFGIVVGVLGGAALGIHADDELDAAALEAHVDPQDLAGAVNSTGVGPREYLRGVGELPVAASTPPVPDALDRVVLCLERYESHGVASAVNPRSGASGPLQFLPSTWRTTPQGKAGLSVFDPIAARAAAKWMLTVGRGREFSTRGLC